MDLGFCNFVMHQIKLVYFKHDKKLSLVFQWQGGRQVVGGHAKWKGVSVTRWLHKRGSKHFFLNKQSRVLIVLIDPGMLQDYIRMVVQSIINV